MEITLKSIRTIFTKSKKTDQSATSTEPNGTSPTVNNLSSTNPPVARRIQNTPFTLVGNDELGYFIGYGHAQITPTYKTKKETLNKLNNNHWEIICNMMTYTVEHWHDIKEKMLQHHNAKTNNTPEENHLKNWGPNY